VLVGQPDHALGGAEPVERVLGEQLTDQVLTRRADQRAASACICPSDANARPRQKLSRTYGIGRPTLALSRA
jgi:hypothetical protein